ncbi:purine-nucleoside phosphorylase [Enhygromyxa salina]|uniref:purine-nucleoside phosphorylase n=1 Tax=Enhygromyxa salina TaxID=215803 RepID=A0A2S9YTR2_9BACT|nr:purine-nucleoside phosphorylase [Enhygromyxa salina]PRQ08507.1 Purine nucleoside phosphorylase [Enhygromyxa salina]
MQFEPNWHPEGALCERALRERLPGLEPVDWMIVGGSGIGKPLVDQAGEHALGLVIQHEIPLAELGLPAPSVAGHGSSLVFGELPAADGHARVRVCVQTGRIHPYEGHPASLATAPLGAVLSLGVKRLLLTCAVGGINPDLRVGTIVSLRDQIGLFGPTPLRGAAFVDCSDIYSAKLRAQLQAQVQAGAEAVPEVVYAHARGPQYETPAEVAALRLLGGDVVGMSTTYEAMLAAAHRTPTCGLGVVTNAAGSEALSHLEVQEESARARSRLSALVRALLRAHVE